MAFLVLLILFPAFGAVLGWLLLRRLSLPLAWLAGGVGGVAPVTLFASAIYRGESGGGDPDPLMFMQLSVGIAIVVTLLTLAGLQATAHRRE